MAGWTYNTGPLAIASIHGPDDAEKTTAFPTVTAGQAQYWQDLAWKIRQLVTQEIKRNGTNVANLTFSANNGTNGDVAGIGTFTISIVTA